MQTIKKAALRRLVSVGILVAIIVGCISYRDVFISSFRVVVTLYHQSTQLEKQFEKLALEREEKLELEREKMLEKLRTRLEKELSELESKLESHSKVMRFLFLVLFLVTTPLMIIFFTIILIKSDTKKLRLRMGNLISLSLDASLLNPKKHETNKNE